MSPGLLRALTAAPAWASQGARPLNCTGCPRPGVAADRLDASPIEPANPYWAEHGLAFADPDGFRVVLAARSWGADVELTDRLAEAGLRRYRELLQRLGD